MTNFTTGGMDFTMLDIGISNPSVTGGHRRISLRKEFYRWSGGEARSRRKHRLLNFGIRIADFGINFFNPHSAFGNPHFGNPAPSPEKPAPHNSKRTGLGSRPWEHQAFTPNFSSSALDHPPFTEGLRAQPRISLTPSATRGRILTTFPVSTP